ncbi:nuclear transport factor 2 family protein [Streptomyces sp. NPDC014744]|uniref:nuclear transport factor 2 family protein n=1 Tax=Streptomyces sp. NPDC014744 TaxID=3364903 RepID=UPI0036F5B07B
MADAHPHAYEARDPDAFEARFTPTAEVWSEGSVLASGRDELRDLYAHQFATPEISAVVLSRAAVGDRVVDVERLTCTGTDPIRALVAYRVQGRLIDEMRLLTLPPEPLLPRALTPDGRAPPRLSPPGELPPRGRLPRPLSSRRPVVCGRHGGGGSRARAQLLGVPGMEPVGAEPQVPVLAVAGRGASLLPCRSPGTAREPFESVLVGEGTRAQCSVMRMHAAITGQNAWARARGMCGSADSQKPMGWQIAVHSLTAPLPTCCGTLPQRLRPGRWEFSRRHPPGRLPRGQLREDPALFGRPGLPGPSAVTATMA